jgi:tetratricopeptide (TPR) repeat protein
VPSPSSIRKWTTRFGLGAGVLIGIGCCAGCFGDELKALQNQIVQQQAQLDQNKQQIEALQTQNASSATTHLPPDACDDAVMHEASRKGGDRFAAGDFPHALAYYQDAATACPKDATAQLNLARSFEATGDRPDALAHYRLAAAGGGADSDTSRQARDALARLQK